MNKLLILSVASRRLGGIFDVDVKREKLEEVSRELENPDIWNDPDKAQKLGQERASLEAVVKTVELWRRSNVLE